MKLLPFMTILLGIAVLVLIWYCRGLCEDLLQLEKDFNELKIEMQENQTEISNCTEYYYEKVKANNENLETEYREDILTLIQKGEHYYESN